MARQSKSKLHVSRGPALERELLAAVRDVSRPIWGVYCSPDIDTPNDGDSSPLSTPEKMTETRDEAEALSTGVAPRQTSAGRFRRLLSKNPLALGGAGFALLVGLLWQCLGWLDVFGREDAESSMQWLSTLLGLLLTVGVAIMLFGLLRSRREPDAPMERATGAAPQGDAPAPVIVVGRPGGANAEWRPQVFGDPQQKYQPRHKPLWNNVISIFGLFLVAMGVVLLLTFGLFSLVTPMRNPYLDIVGYMVLPGLLILGLMIVPAGILFKSWRLRRHDPHQPLTLRFPRIDLNDPAQRRVIKYFFAGTFMVLPVVGVSGYHGYHYTDSSQFCGYACHDVMKPQATAYEHSAHARVSCAECHIGSGASWFVKSKLSGTRQVFATWQNSYPRPIPPAITELRPARETCERCHWPQKFFGAQLREITHFASDEKNTRRHVDMLIRTGGKDEAFRSAEGIHTHMALTNRIEYVATDDRLQDITWVRMTNEAGDVSIYRSDGRPSSDPRPEGLIRQLDCMDCHNRPAHKFRSPQESVDLFLEGGGIDRSLPFVKREAMAVLSTAYPDSESAKAQIGLSLTEFYQTNYPELWESRRSSIYQAIDAIRMIYDRNFFPDMKVDWRTYPDNIGHKISPGCFRCHEGKHVNQDGRTISHECSVCHTFLNPKEKDAASATIVKGEFIHPMELAGPHKALRCDRCHTGGIGPETTCKGCHKLQQGLYGATMDTLAPFDVKPSPMFGVVDCEGCHDLSQTLSVENVDALCMDCHDDEEDKYEGMLAGWVTNIAKARTEAEQSIKQLEEMLAGDANRESSDELRIRLTQSRSALELLDKAGPQHNPDAALKIYGAISQQAGQSAPAAQAD